MSSPSQPGPNNNHSTHPDDSRVVNNPQTNFTNPTYIPDSTYYYPDDSAVFLVEGVLFKLQASLILPPNSISSISGDDSQRYPIGVDNLPCKLSDSSDANPIILPNVTASQFRNYLFALLGSPSDPLYLDLLTDAKDPSKHNRDLLARYLDISCLARQFGKSELEQWARSQLLLVLESMCQLVESDWDKDTLLRLNSYARSTKIEDFISSTRTFIQYFISISADTQPCGQEPLSSNLDTCVEMYKDPNLASDDPALFGCIFVSILSLGHRSAAWASMTQRERAVLYAAQVQLVSVSAELKDANWLQPIATTQSLPWMHQICNECQLQFEDLWEVSFGKCNGLKSSTPLQDVTELARLPQYRQLLVSRWSSPDACAIFTVRRQPDNPQTGSFVSTFRRAVRSYYGVTQTALTVDRVDCPKLKLPLADIDRRIQLVYTELAGQRESFTLEG